MVAISLTPKLKNLDKLLAHCHRRRYTAKSTIIYAGEPVWGGIFGRMAGDRLPGMAVIGAVLIVAGVVVSELKPRSRTEAAGPADENNCAAVV